MKRCPSCAGAIQGAAARCRACGAALASASGIRTVAKVLGALLAIAGGALAMGAIATCEAPNESPARAPRVVDVTPRQLRDAYRANEVAADDTYRGNALHVIGKASAIKRDFVDAPYMVLDTGDAFAPVHAHFDTDAGLAAIRQGQRVTLRCIGDRAVMGSPVLRHCVVE